MTDREELESRAVEEICACRVYDLQDSLQETTDAELQSIIDHTVKCETAVTSITCYNWANVQKIVNMQIRVWMTFVNVRRLSPKEWFNMSELLLSSWHQPAINNSKNVYKKNSRSVRSQDDPGINNSSWIVSVYASSH
jgi:hypothetical protein